MDFSDKEFNFSEIILQSGDGGGGDQHREQSALVTSKIESKSVRPNISKEKKKSAASKPESATVSEMSASHTHVLLF